MAKIAPSFLAVDIWRVAAQIQALEQAGCEYLHLDVMDGNFVPNISFGPAFIKGLRPHSKMVFDAHLMVEEPARFLADYAEAGCDLLVVHAEACRHLHRTVEAVKALGMRAGVALNPATPLGMVEELLAELDLVLLMSVNPGFCGQKFIPATLAKLQRLQAQRQESGQRFLIQVDGGVGLANARQLADLGADLLVAGSAVFGAADIAQAYTDLSNMAK